MLANKRTVTRKESTITQCKARILSRKIAAILKEDYKERSRKADKVVMVKMEAGNVKEAW